MTSAVEKREEHGRNEKAVGLSLKWRDDNEENLGSGSGLMLWLH
jgi:hypothetical protein